MAETENISKMAEKISKEIFEVFGWTQVGPMNINWPCNDDKHKNSSDKKKNTHPTDVVFKYQEPYSSKVTYLNLDLKSYAENSITLLGVQNALQSLAMAVDCAWKNEEWKKNFVDTKGDIQVNGLLFIYNHDGEYKNDFDTILDFVDTSKLIIPKHHRLYVLGPKDIIYLYSVANDIKVKRGEDLIPRGKLSFYYPDLTNKRTNSAENLPASLEMLLSPYISFKYKLDDKKILRLYYRDRGTETKEFLYLFDYLFHYQQFQECDEIIISLYNCDGQAFSLFENAKNIYKEDRENSNNLTEILKKIKCESVNTVFKRFSSIEIGMEGR